MDIYLFIYVLIYLFIYYVNNAIYWKNSWVDDCKGSVMNHNGLC